MTQLKEQVGTSRFLSASVIKGVQLEVNHQVSNSRFASDYKTQTEHV